MHRDGRTHPLANGCVRGRCDDQHRFVRVDAVSQRSQLGRHRRVSSIEIVSENQYRPLRGFCSHRSGERVVTRLHRLPERIIHCRDKVSPPVFRQALPQSTRPARPAIVPAMSARGAMSIDQPCVAGDKSTNGGPPSRRIDRRANVIQQHPRLMLAPSGRGATHVVAAVHGFPGLKRGNEIVCHGESLAL